MARMDPRSGSVDRGDGSAGGVVGRRQRFRCNPLQRPRSMFSDETGWDPASSTKHEPKGSSKQRVVGRMLARVDRVSRTLPWWHPAVRRPVVTGRAPVPKRPLVPRLGSFRRLLGATCVRSRRTESAIHSAFRPCGYTTEGVLHFRERGDTSMNHLDFCSRRSGPGGAWRSTRVAMPGMSGASPRRSARRHGQARIRRRPPRPGSGPSAPASAGCSPRASSPSIR